MKTTTIRIEVPNKYERVVANSLSPRERLQAIVQAGEEKMHDDEKSDDQETLNQETSKE